MKVTCVVKTYNPKKYMDNLKKNRMETECLKGGQNMKREIKAQLYSTVASFFRRILKEMMVCLANKHRRLM